MDNHVSSIQAEAMPPILPGDIIAVYSAHESAWGKPAQTYCVRRVESNGTPVSDMDFHHFLSDVVNIYRKKGKDYVCIYRKESYEIRPWEMSYLYAFAESLPEETKEKLANYFQEWGKTLDNFYEKNKEAVTPVLAASLTFSIIKLATNAMKGEAI